MRIEDAIRVAAAAGFIVEAQSGMLHASRMSETYATVQF